MRVLLVCRHRLFLIYAVLFVYALAITWSAARHAPVVDEPNHLAAGLRHLTNGSFELNRGNPPLVDTIAAIPAVLAGAETDWSQVPRTHMVGITFIRINGIRLFWLVTMGRWMLLPIGILGGYLCYRWARELYGRDAGVLALCLWCFCPLIVANTELITGDMSSATAATAVVYCFWRWLKRPGYAGALLCGAVLGIAQLTKYVNVCLYVVLPVLFVCWVILSRLSLKLTVVKCLQGSFHILLMFVVSFYVINVGYGFTGTCQKLERYATPARLLSRIGFAEPAGPNHKLPAWLASLPVPLPFDYVKGIDEITSLFATEHRTYLCGEWKDGGWWYYYPFGLLIKMPLGFWVIFLISVLMLLLTRRRSPKVRWRDDVMLVIPPLAFLIFITYVGTLQYLRYALPAVPFLIVLAARAGIAFRRHALIQKIAICVSAAWVFVSFVMIYPHSGSYFNELVGGPRNGHAYLVESSIGWGQDLIYFKEWLDQHPEVQDLHFAYFNIIDPNVIGIDYQLPKPMPSRASLTALLPPEEQGPQPGWHAVSASLLRGFWLTIPDGKGGMRSSQSPDFEYFRRFEPVAVIGHSIYVYHLEFDEVNQVRKELGLPLLDSAGPGKGPAGQATSSGPPGKHPAKHAREDSNLRPTD